MAQMLCLGQRNDILQVQCQPVSHQWEQEAVPGTCWSPTVFGDFAIAESAYGVLIDLVLTIYPLVTISRLQMNQKDKLAVMFILSLGFLTTAATFYKAVFVFPKLRNLKSDFSLLMGPVLLWGVVEMSSAIIAGSVLTWGWVFRTISVRQIVGWIRSKIFALIDTSQRLGSQASEVDRESDRVELTVVDETSKSRKSEAGDIQV